MSGALLFSFVAGYSTILVLVLNGLNGYFVAPAITIAAIFHLYSSYKRESRLDRRRGFSNVKEEEIFTPVSNDGEIFDEKLANVNCDENSSSIPLEVTNFMANDGKSSVVTPNSHTPYEFETEGFKGRMQIKIKTNPEDPYFSSYFSGKRRLFEIQFQGKFKVNPPNDVMIGVELPGPMNLGLMLRVIVRTIISVMQLKIPGIKVNITATAEEMPYGAIPILGATDCFLVTPDGKPVPHMGVEMFDTITPEEKKSIVIDTQHTYSFSYHSSCVDFTQWKICNVPGVPEMNIRTFVGDMDPIMILFYMNNEGKKVYLSKFEFKSIFGKEHIHKRSSTSNLSSPVKNLPAVVIPIIPRKTNTNFTISVPSWIEATYKSMGSTAPAFTILVNDQRDSTAKKKRILVKEYADIIKLSSHFSSLCELCGISTADIDPFLLNFPTKNYFDCKQRLAIESQRVLIENYLNLLVENNFGNYLAISFLSETSPTVTLADATVIESSKTMLAHGHSKRRGDVIKECVAIRARWESYWREEWMVLYATQIRFLKSYGRKQSFEINIDQIVTVKAILPENSPVVSSGMFYFEIETPSFVAYVGILSEMERNAWVTAIKKLSGIESTSRLDRLKSGVDNLRKSHCNSDLEDVLNSRDSNANVNVNINGEGSDDEAKNLGEEAKKEAAAISLTSFSNFVRWKEAGRVILNCRRLGFQPYSGIISLDAVKVVENLLNKALCLTPTSSPKDLLQLMDDATELKFVDIRSFANENSALCFWLNIFHLLVQMESCLLNPSYDVNSRVKHFKKISLEIGSDQMFSIDEVEQRVLRSKGAGTTFYSAKPKDKLPFQTLQKAEPRINFILNNGTTSCLDNVCVFTPEKIEAQLNQGASEFLDKFVTIDETLKQIILPKVCEWYVLDFINGKKSLNVANQSLEKIFQYASPTLKNKFDNICNLNPKVIYMNYVWEFKNCLTIKKENNFK